MNTHFSNDQTACVNLLKSYYISRRGFSLRVRLRTEPNRAKDPRFVFLSCRWRPAGLLCQLGGSSDATRSASRRSRSDRAEARPPQNAALIRSIESLGAKRPPNEQENIRIRADVVGPVGARVDGASKNKRDHQDAREKKATVLPFV